jgi:phage protein D
MRAGVFLSLPGDLNSIALSGVRQPRVAFTVNGVPVPGLIEAEVTNNSHFASDTFHAVLALSLLPPAYGPAYWSNSIGDQIGISAGFAGEQMMPLILGQVDDTDYDPVRRTITLSGRDLSARLIDTRSAEKFVNKTSSQIAEELAQRHGLVPVVKPTTAKAGTYYSAEHVVLTKDQTEWDLLTYLAEREGFDVWVSGDRLHFEPSPLPTNPPYKIAWDEAALASNALDIHLTRSQTLAKDVIVVVQSFNQKQQKAFKVTYKVTQGYKSQRVGGQAQIYSFNEPNLTRDQCLALAKAKAEEITRHERVLTASLPGDSTLTTRAMVQLVGTGTSWDQMYFPDTVTRRIGFDGGYRMDLRAKNHSVQSTVVLG